MRDILTGQNKVETAKGEALPRRRRFMTDLMTTSRIQSGPTRCATTEPGLDLNLLVKGKDPMSTLATIGLLVTLAPVIFIGIAAMISFVVEDSVRTEIGR